MKYIIHSTVIFDTTEYILKLLTDTKTSIKLSNPAGRILEELIKNQKTCELITREHLFLKVWKNHGLEPSHGNLNQQISLIRKSFNLLGINPASIITIPKRGLKLNHQISIKIIEKNGSNIIPSNIVNNNQHRKIPELSESNLLKINIKYIIISLILIITILSISILYLYIKDKNLKKLYLYKQINSCNICTFHQKSDLECNDLTFKIPENNTNNLDNYNNYCIKIHRKKYFYDQ